MEGSETERILKGMSDDELKGCVHYISGEFKRYVPVPSGTPLKELYFTPHGRFALPGCPAMSLAKDFDVCRAERGQELGTAVQPSGYEHTYRLNDIPVFDGNKFTRIYPRTHEEIYKPNGEDKYEVSHEMVRIIRHRMGSDVQGFEGISVSGHVQGHTNEPCVHLWPEASGNVRQIDSGYWSGGNL